MYGDSGRTMITKYGPNGGACPPTSPLIKSVDQCLPPGVYVRGGCRMWPLPFFNVSVAAGAQVPIVTQSQYDFQGELLIVSSTIAAFFTIDDLQVATVGQLARAGRMHAQMFSEDAAQNWLNFDPVDSGTDITMTVTNLDVVNAHLFSAVIIGRTVSRR